MAVSELELVFQMMFVCVFTHAEREVLWCVHCNYALETMMWMDLSLPPPCFSKFTKTAQVKTYPMRFCLPANLYFAHLLEFVLVCVCVCVCVGGVLTCPTLSFRPTLKVGLNKICKNPVRPSARRKMGNQQPIRSVSALLSVFVFCVCHILWLWGYSGEQLRTRASMVNTAFQIGETCRHKNLLFLFFQQQSNKPF